MDREDLERKHLIVERLSRTLKSGIDTPEKVVYLLVEAIKLLDLNNERRDILRFYRNWVAHSKLEYDKTIIKFFGKLERHIVEGAGGRSVATRFIENEPDFFNLNTLKKELKKFLSKNKLPCRLTTNHICWKNFLKILLGILKECTIEPIIPKEILIRKLSLVDDKNGKPSFKFNLNSKVRPPMVKLTL